MNPSSPPSSPHVYDKAKYHAESVEEAGLPEAHASHHMLPALRWLVDKGLMGGLFAGKEGREALAAYKSGELDIHGLYAQWDHCLISDMLSDEGNAFAMHYIDLRKGAYLADYIGALQGDLPTEYHVPWTEENYATMRAIIDQRYAAWKQSRPAPVAAAPAPQRKPWWRFWA